MSGNFDSTRTIFPSIIFILTPILGVGSLLCWTLIAHRRGTLLGPPNARRTWRGPFRIPDEDLEDKTRIKPVFLETWISSVDLKPRGVVIDNVVPLAMQAQSGEDSGPKSSSEDRVEAVNDEPYMISVFISMPSDIHPHYLRNGTPLKEEDWREDTSLTMGTADVVVKGPIAWSGSKRPEAKPQTAE